MFGFGLSLCFLYPLSDLITSSLFWAVDLLVSPWIGWEDLGFFLVSRETLTIFVLGIRSAKLLYVAALRGEEKDGVL